jgi:glucosylceramidase
MRSKINVFALAIWIVCCNAKCSSKGSDDPNPPPPPASADVESWITKGDQSALLQKQTTIMSFTTTGNGFPFIDVDTTAVFQTMDGFGYTLTSGSAEVINRLAPSTKTDLLNELFGNGSNSISISYLRISMGASDLSSSVYSYDDMPAGQKDTGLTQFSLNPDKTDLIPLLKQILAINPSIKILATPWSPPVWMKDNGSSIGGSLKPEYYGVYANYFVKYIQAMKNEGITIDAITPQNEPLHPGNNPSMYMEAPDEAIFIKSHLGPAFQAAGITTKIIVYDHNCDRPDYPLTILNDAAAKAFVDGSAFHLYNGQIEALTQVHNAHPDKHVYFTEQYTANDGNFEGDLRWHVRNLIVGAPRNWSRNVLEWNLANDPNWGPHTPGGCTTCKGALTIGANVTRNVAYYIIAHASKFVPPGSVRIGSNITGSMYNVAYKTPAGKKVLIVVNDGTQAGSFNIRFNGKWAPAFLPAGAVATYIW